MFGFTSVDGILISFAKSIGTDALMFARLYMDGRGAFDKAMRAYQIGSYAIKDVMQGLGVKAENTMSYAHLYIVGSGRFDQAIEFGVGYLSKGQSNYDMFTVIGAFDMEKQSVQFQYETDRRIFGFDLNMSASTKAFDPIEVCNAF